MGNFIVRNCLSIYRAPNITTVIVGRFLNGAFGSTGATMVGGSIADIWPANEYVPRNFIQSIASE
jgi:hypothetical protein